MNSGHLTGHVHHLDSRIGKLVSSFPSLGCRNTSANLQGHIARARDLKSNFRNLTETWWLLWRPLGSNALSGNEVDMCGLLFSVCKVLATKFQRLLRPQPKEGEQQLPRVFLLSLSGLIRHRMFQH